MISNPPDIEGPSVSGAFRGVNSWNNKSVRWHSSNNLPEVKNTALYQAVKKLIWGIFSIREYKYSPFLWTTISKPLYS